MQDSIRSDDVEAGRAMKKAFGLLAGLGLAVAVGLIAVDQPEVDSAPRVLGTDANWHRVPGLTSSPPSAPSAAPARGELDPLLLRPERGNDHHG